MLRSKFYPHLLYPIYEFNLLKVLTLKVLTFKVMSGVQVVMVPSLGVSPVPAKIVSRWVEGLYNFDAASKVTIQGWNYGPS